MLRLVLDGIAAGLFLFGFAYFSQGNTSHELAGMAMFVLLFAHAMFHRRWFVRQKSRPRVRHGRFNLLLTCLLLAGMLALLGSSLLISETLFAALRLRDDFTARQIHAGIAYWLLLVVAMHLGLRWPLLMAVGARLLGLGETNVARTALLRLFSAAITLQGVYSALALNLRSRLLFQLSLDWWNFEESVAGFFGHCMAVAGLCMCLTHYSMQWLQRQRSRQTVEAV